MGVHKLDLEFEDEDEIKAREEEERRKKEVRQVDLEFSLSDSEDPSVDLTGTREMPYTDLLIEDEDDDIELPESTKSRKINLKNKSSNLDESGLLSPSSSQTARKARDESERTRTNISSPSRPRTTQNTGSITRTSTGVRQLPRQMPYDQPDGGHTPPYATKSPSDPTYKLGDHLHHAARLDRVLEAELQARVQMAVTESRLELVANQTAEATMLDHNVTQLLRQILAKAPGVKAEVSRIKALLEENKKVKQRNEQFKPEVRSLAARTINSTPQQQPQQQQSTSNPQIRKSRPEGTAPPGTKKRLPSKAGQGGGNPSPQRVPPQKSSEGTGTFKRKLKKKFKKSS